MGCYQLYIVIEIKELRNKAEFFLLVSLSCPDFESDNRNL